MFPQNLSGKCVAIVTKLLALELLMDPLRKDSKDKQQMGNITQKELLKNIKNC
jgi:hypothetical protein